MRDDAYLAEEAGRRATANRLLDLIAAHVPSGRLLDVGCGHGLLLDEARKRGYETVGLELSREAARHARETLGLDVRELPLEAFGEGRNGDSPGEFDAIVLADVLEHLDDPVAAIDTCARLLRPGGVLCIVTPDPSSVTARAAGARWWGYLPAHTVLLPRKTLRELISARGLVISDDVPFVRTFAARRWVGGLAERLGPAQRAAERRRGADAADVAQPLARRRARDPRPPHAGPERRSSRCSTTATARAVHVVLPAYRATRTIPDVVAEMPVESADRALLIDDASRRRDEHASRCATASTCSATPPTAATAPRRRPATCARCATAPQVIVMVHADNQYDPGLVAEMAAPILAGEADIVIGSRLLDDRAIAGGMPRWKWLGNRLLTGIENRAFGVRFSEYHTGYRAFSADFLRSIPFLRNSDDFVFDQEIFAQMLARGARVREIPIPTRYFHEASSVDFVTSLRYAFKTLCRARRATGSTAAGRSCADPPHGSTRTRG